MSLVTSFIWVALLAILAGVVYWHLRENRELIERSRKAMPADQSVWLSRFAWSRSIQLFAALSCSFLVIIFYSYELDEARETIDALSLASQTPPPAIAQEPQPQAEAAPPETAQPVILESVNEPFEAPLEEIAAENPAQATFDQVSAETPAVSPEVKVAATEPEATGVDDVYKPSESKTDGQSTMDTLKQRYEDMLVTYFFLDKCGLAEKNDYYIIMAALSQDMASVNAPGRMQYDILTAARGSYDEVYAQSPCDSVDIQTLQTQYKDYIAVLAQYGQN